MRGPEVVVDEGLIERLDIDPGQGSRYCDLCITISESNKCLENKIKKENQNKNLCRCKSNCHLDDAESSPSSWRDIPMSDQDERLIRRLWRSPGLKGLKGSTKWGYVFGGYVRSLPPSSGKLFREVLRRFPDMCEACFIEYLKDFSRRNLLHVLENDERWRVIFLDLKVLGGFDTVLNRLDPPCTLR